MRLHIEKSGRVVLPKPLRRRTGLRAGAELELTEAAGGHLLRPTGQAFSLIERDGLLVHTGQPTRTLDWRQLSQDLEDKRLQDIFGR